MLDMVDTHTDMDMLDTTASVMLSLRPRLIPIFCMEVMAMAMLDTLAMLDTMDTPMLDMPTMDKLIIRPGYLKILIIVLTSPADFMI